jgi:4-phosphopantoate--beta-alanine ligase
MNPSIPHDHPRRESLILREKIFEASKEGLLAPVASIAHGRGEAFDYILGEKTIESAKNAISIAATLLLTAKHPVISVNGNTAVLAREELLEIAKELNCPIEINIFYRTEERMKKLFDFMKNDLGVTILGTNQDKLIPNLSSERAKSSSGGIIDADVVFVPLEDGDRCEALIKIRKKVIAVDLNPFSRTARTASLTIVDNVTRAVKLLLEDIRKLKVNQITKSDFKIDNKEFLNSAVDEIKERIEEFKKHSVIKF